MTRPLEKGGVCDTVSNGTPGNVSGIRPDEVCAPVAQGREQLPSKQPVGGSNPSGRARASKIRVFEATDPTESAPLGNGSPPPSASERIASAEAFLLQKRVDGCTDATLRACRFWLDRFGAEVRDVAALNARFPMFLNDIALRPIEDLGRLIWAHLGPVRQEDGIQGRSGNWKQEDVSNNVQGGRGDG